MDALPTLSPEGFITNKTIMMTKLYEYFLSSDYSQSNTFYTTVVSLKYIISEAKDSEDMRTMVIEALDKMYSKYYKSVIVDIVIKDTLNTMHITVNVNTIGYDGKAYSLSELIQVTDNKIINYDKLQEQYYA